MATCLNCKKNLSCGCQKKIASDGKSVCATCITLYEININKKILNPIQPTPSQVWANKNSKK
jgi:PIN domain nuclease of toxin-antitoxin system